MSLFKLLPGVFNLSEIPNIAPATMSVRPDVFALLFIRLGNVQRIFSWEVRASWVLPTRCSVSVPTCFSSPVSVLTSQWSSRERALAATCEGSLCRTGMLNSTEHGKVCKRLLKISKMLWIEACCYSCAMPLDVLVNFVFKLLTGAPFSTKKL